MNKRNTKKMNKRMRNAIGLLLAMVLISSLFSHSVFGGYVEKLYVDMRAYYAEESVVIEEESGTDVTYESEGSGPMPPEIIENDPEVEVNHEEPSENGDEERSVNLEDDTELVDAEDEEDDESYEEIMALSACGGTVIASGGLGGTNPAQWELCGDCFTVTVGEGIHSGTGTIHTPNNTNTLNQSLFPAAYRPLIGRIVFAEPVVATSMHDMFNGLTSLTAIENIGNIDVSAVSNFRRAFYQTSSLGSVDLSMWNTGNATNMYRMFGNTGASALNLGGSFNTGGLVNNMGSMFWGASNLATIGEVGGWNTGNATRMSRMFQGASSLTHVNVGSWNTSNVTLMYNMFHNASSLTTLDIGGWNVSNVLRMDVMFSGATGLTRLDLSGWNTTSLQRMDNMFDGASGLVYLNLAGFDTAGVVNRNNILRGLPNLRVLTLGSGWYWNAFNGTGLPNPPSNETYTGHWRNVESGTIHSPLGDHLIFSGQLFNNELFNDPVNPNIANVWVWNPRVPQHMVTFISDDNGTIDAPADPNFVFVLGGDPANTIAALAIEYTANSNYKLSHWTSNQHPGTFTTDELRELSITGNTTFTAHFVRINHPVTFILNGGNVSGDVEDIEQSHDQGATINQSNVPAPARSGWTFLGWFRDNQGLAMTAAEIGELTVTEPMSFTARWVQDVPVITNPGNYGDENNNGNDNGSNNGSHEDNDDKNNGNNEENQGSNQGTQGAERAPETNEENRSPQTGDDSLVNALLYLFTFFLSMTLIVTLIVRRIKAYLSKSNDKN